MKKIREKGIAPFLFALAAFLQVRMMSGVVSERADTGAGARERGRGIRRMTRRPTHPWSEENCSQCGHKPVVDSDLKFTRREKRFANIPIQIFQIKVQWQVLVPKL